MNEETTPISSLTMYRASFVASFGYGCSLRRKADNYLDDEMKVTDGTNSFSVTRRGLFDFIARRHNVKRTGKKPAFYVIEHPNWFESLDYIS